MLKAKLDKYAARRFLAKAIKEFCVPEKVNIDKNGANLAAIKSYNKNQSVKIGIWQKKYFNNIVEQYHRAVRHLIRLIVNSRHKRPFLITAMYRKKYESLKKWYKQ